VIFLVYIFYSSIFLRHQTMDKVQKYNSFNSFTAAFHDNFILLIITQYI